MRILIVEDDERLCESLRYQLVSEGFEIDLCHDGEDGLYYIQEQAHDLILLDRMLPKMDGLTVLRKARSLGIFTPVILVTALGEINDRVDGLDCGADDYITKPFALSELMARIRCIFRRPQRWENLGTLTFGDLAYETEQKTLSCGTRSCTLSKREGELLEFFLRNPRQVIPRSVLLSRVWGPDAEVENGNLDNYIHFLRRRIRAVDSSLILKTLRGVGYRLEGPDA